MQRFFVDALHEQLGTWPLAYIPYGGADYGEVARIAHEVGDGDDNAFHAVWTGTADRLAAEADAALAQHRHASARELYLRAACFYARSYAPLFGRPVDPRLVSSHRAQVKAFAHAMALGDEPAIALHIPFEGMSLPAYLVPAVGYAGEVRPLVIFTNGYDGAMTDLYFAAAVAATRRGYHALIFDGPGQGEMLIEHGLPLRPDWEVVVRAVVDRALALPQVDPARIALSGWSLGGYLAPRAASGEPRLAACIADPGQSDIASGFRAFAVRLGAPPAAAARLATLDHEWVQRMWQVFVQDRKLHWSIVRRGLWVHGVESLRDYLRVAETFTLEGRVDRIRCPTLLTLAEDDPLTHGTQALFDRLRCRKTLARFTARQGAGGHCEMGNRSRLNRVVLDWLDGVMRDQPGTAATARRGRAWTNRYPHRAHHAPSHLRMITLYSYPELFGVADNNPFGLKVFAFLKLSGLPFSQQHIFDATAAPRGQLPYIVDEGRVVGDSDAIVAHLTARHGIGLDRSLSAAQRTTDLLVRRALDDLYWVMSYSRWRDERFWPAFRDAMLTSHPGLTAEGMDAARAYNFERYRHQGIGRHEPEQVYARGTATLDALASLVPGQGWLFGPQPVSTDAALYGFVANILYFDIDTPLRRFVAARPALLRHTQDMHARMTG